jgi:hypothetical protein
MSGKVRWGQSGLTYQSNLNGPLRRLRDGGLRFTPGASRRPVRRRVAGAPPNLEASAARALRRCEPDGRGLSRDLSGSGVFQTRFNPLRSLSLAEGDC